MNLLPLTILFPLAGFVLLAFRGSRLSERAIALIGVGSMFGAAATAAFVGAQFLLQPTLAAHQQVLWTWIGLDALTVRFALYLDELSLTLLGVITGVGALIHWFAAWYMRGETGYARFFAAMNLFVASMLVLVLADNLLLMFLGWEGVGLCSYLLIGFYFQEPANGAAARKAFIVTRCGDTLLAIGMFFLFREFATLDMAAINAAASGRWPVDSQTPLAIALLLLGGAMGKSAQVPLHTWLPDAMAGPTPVSALIHAATMVTAGVYLIARMHPLFLAAPDAMFWVGSVGALTALLAAFSAMVQSDIKRVLAYSTMSQLGYMFIALGAGAWQAAIFHLLTHAFFKALLFLAAGAVILACHHEQNIFRMGGLRKTLPFVYAVFVIGGLALAALPYVTAGFYSKEAVLAGTVAAQQPLWLVVGLAGSILTAFYTARLVFLVFHGPQQTEAHADHSVAVIVPLGLLALLSTFVGSFLLPPLSRVLPAEPDQSHLLWLVGLSVTAVFCGLLTSFLAYRGDRQLPARIAATSLGKAATNLWRDNWAFDRVYDRLFVKPFLALAGSNHRDSVDAVVEALPRLTQKTYELLQKTETGHLRWYYAMLAGGVTVLMLLMF